MEILINIRRQFRGGPEIAASLAVARAPVTVLFGPSGCGKTTVLRCIAGVERPDSGTIRVGDQVWFDSGLGINLRPQRRRIGYVFQEHALFPHLTVRSNIGYGLRGSSSGRIDQMVEMFDLGDFQHRRPGQLSGGQRQRVALARALAPGPDLLLMDEPLASLDAPLRESLRGELRSMILRAQTPALVVTHDRVEALALGDHIAVMSGGRIRQQGPVQEIFSRPVDDEVARAVGVETVVQGEVIAGEGSIAEVRTGSAVLIAHNPLKLRGGVLVCIRGEDVMLRRVTAGDEASSPTSARNALRGRIVTINEEGALSRLAIDCGFHLTALITRSAREELRLIRGEEVIAMVKATSLHLVAHEGIKAGAMDAA